MLSNRVMHLAVDVPCLLALWALMSRFMLGTGFPPSRFTDVSRPLIQLQFRVKKYFSQSFTIIPIIEILRTHLLTEWASWSMIRLDFACENHS